MFPRQYVILRQDSASSRSSPILSEGSVWRRHPDGNRDGEKISLLYDAPEPRQKNALLFFFSSIRSDVATKCYHFQIHQRCFCILTRCKISFILFLLIFSVQILCYFYTLTVFSIALFLFVCCFASLSPSVSVSLLVFFWKITRSGAVRVHVFCAGYTDWKGWLHWAGFLCGPPANFMIYSAKGRGARPPVTTERELHVGLMISPQKCLLWLGLHGAQTPPAGWMVEREGGLKREFGWPAWVNTSAYHYTFTCRGLRGRRE